MEGATGLEKSMSKTRALIICVTLVSSRATLGAAQEGWAPDALAACPAAADTLWASDSTAPPPRVWIVGALRPAPHLFSDVPWSKTAVLPHTLKRMRDRVYTVGTTDMPEPVHGWHQKPRFT